MANRKAIITCLLALVCCGTTAKSHFLANGTLNAFQRTLSSSASSSRFRLGRNYPGSHFRFPQLIKPLSNQTDTANFPVLFENGTSVSHGNGSSTPFPAAPNTTTIAAANLTTTASSNHSIPVSNLTTPFSNLTTPSSNHSIPVSNLTTPFSNLTTPSSNHSIPVSNLTTPFSNLTTPSSNHSFPVSNLTTPFSNLTTPSSNHSIPVSNLTTPFSNLTTPSSNHSIPVSNLTTPFSNRTTPSSNGTVPSTLPPSPYVPEPGEPYGCRKVSPCVCQIENRARVDLSPLANTNGTPRFLDVADYTGQYTYSWNPCYSFNEGACSNVAVCQRDAKAAPPYQNYYNLGSQERVDFEVSSNRGLMMQYTATGVYVPLRTTYIQLRCDPSVEAEFTAQGEPITYAGVYYFTLRSRYACLIGSPRNTTSTPVSTRPTPGAANVTVTAAPTANPVYSLKTVVDLLFVLTVVALAGLVVLLMVLVAVIVRRSLGTSTNDTTAVNGKV